MIKMGVQRLFVLFLYFLIVVLEKQKQKQASMTINSALALLQPITQLVLTAILISKSLCYLHILLLSLSRHLLNYELFIHTNSRIMFQSIGTDYCTMDQFKPKRQGVPSALLKIVAAFEFQLVFERLPLLFKSLLLQCRFVFVPGAFQKTRNESCIVGTTKI